MATSVGTAGAGAPDRGARAALEHGWETFRAHFWILFGASVVAYLINGVGTVLQVGLPMAGTPEGLAAVLGIAWSFVVGTPVGAGLQYAYLRGARGESPEMGDLLSGFPVILSLIGASILVGVAVVVGFILLVIPGIYAALRLAYVPLLVVDKDLDAVEAVKRSWNGMGGNVLELFLLVLASFLILVVGIILLLVGVIPAGVWVMSSYVSFYRSVFEGDDPTPVESGGTPDDPTHVPEPG